MEREPAPRARRGSDSRGGDPGWRLSTEPVVSRNSADQSAGAARLMIEVVFDDAARWRAELMNGRV